MTPKEGKRPDFFIVGAAKCGTTSLHAYLSQHPDVYMPRVKELHYFGSDINPPRLARTTEEYLRFFDDAEPHQVAGEASPSYLYSKRAAREIHAFNPRARILVMLRNPVDMMHSLHFQKVAGGREEIDDFEAALDAEARRRDALARGVGGEDSARLRRLLYRDRARLSEQLERYLGVFPREQVHVILFDDLLDDTAGVYRGVCEFLGVDAAFQPEFTVENPSQQARFPAIQRLIHRIPGLNRLRRATVTRPRLGALLNAIWRANLKRATRPPMDAALRERLTREMATEVERLEALLGRDLSHWRATPPRGGGGAPDARGASA